MENTLNAAVAQAPRGPMIAGIEIAPHDIDKQMMEHEVHPIVAWSAVMAVMYMALMPMVNFM